MENNTSNNQLYNQEEETIDLRKIFNYFIGNIHWFILSVVFALGIAYLANRYTTKIYSAYTTVLIEDQGKNSMMGAGGMDFTQGFGMFPSLQNYENQTIIIQSYGQIRRTIEELDFEVSYYSQGRLSQREIYKQAPFEVIFFRDSPQLMGANFKIEINSDGGINIAINEENKILFNYAKDEHLGRISLVEYENTVRPGERVQTNYFDFYIRINENFDPNAESNKYFFFFNTPHQLTVSYQRKLTLEPMAKGSSMLRISLQDNNPSKAMDFLNTLTSEYMVRNLEKKNEIALNTIRFIDSQLDTISKSLNIAESDLESFRSRNQVMDLSFQAQQIFQQLQSLENQKMEIEMQTQYYQYLLSYIEESQDEESILAPSAMGVNDPLLNQLILEINQLSVEKSSYTNIRKGADLMIMQQLEARIRNAKNNIYENASNLVKSSKMSLREIDRRITELMISINSLPETERELFGIQRKFQLNDNLYTFLLERQAESQIAMASNAPDNEIIDHALMGNNGHPIKPKNMINYMIGLMLGLILPAAVIALREYFNMKVDSPEVVKRITNKPIIGYIPSTGESDDMTMFDYPDSPWAEAFRIVRTKMQFITKDATNPAIMITSSIPGEGKSFIAINLASAYALTGKKTLLIGFDLRRPQIAQRFHLEKNIGVTNFLIGEATLEQIIQKSSNKNLDIITSGVIPPNPAELISDSRTLDFISDLKTKYDYIIIDSAPMSPVSDSHHLALLVDATVFVVRDRFTHKHALEASMDEANNIKIKNLTVLMNDIRLSRKRYGGRYGYSYGYKYGYKYGYGYGYGYEKEKGSKKRKKNKA